MTTLLVLKSATLAGDSAGSLFTADIVIWQGAAPMRDCERDNTILYTRYLKVTNDAVGKYVGCSDLEFEYRRKKSISTSDERKTKRTENISPSRHAYACTIPVRLSLPHIVIIPCRRCSPLVILCRRRFSHASDFSGLRV